MKKFKLFSAEEIQSLAKLLLKDEVKTMMTSTKSFKEEPEKYGAFKIIVSTDDMDRVGDIIRVDSWELDNYEKNPIVLLNHDYDDLPIGITTKISIQGNKIIAEGYFAPEEANPKAQQVRKLYDLGMISAASVGFIPKQFDAANPQIITRSELLEWSFVTVPCNPNAVSMRQLKEKGISDAVIAEFKLEKVVSEEKSEEAVEKQEVKPENVERLKKNISNMLAKSATELTNLITNLGVTMMQEIDSVIPAQKSIESEEPKTEEETTETNEPVTNEQVENLAEGIKGFVVEAEKLLARLSAQANDKNVSQTDFVPTESKGKAANYKKSLELINAVLNETLKQK